MNNINKLRGSLKIEYTLAQNGAKKLRELISKEQYIAALGCVTGCQAVQCVQAGLKAIYVSGWQVAADANNSGQTYPDLSLYPSDSVPTLVGRINKALQRADQIDCAQDKNNIDYYVPIVADCEAGYGGNLNTFELVKACIEAGAGAIHLEDQLASAKKCGHLGGKVVIPIKEFINKLKVARLASIILDVPMIIIARTDADSAKYLSSDIDQNDHQFKTNTDRTTEGYYPINNGINYAIHRALAYAPYCDMLWCETSKPDLYYASQFADAIHRQYPDKWLAYNLSPSFNWGCLSNKELFDFQSELGKLGYKFQFVTLAGFHSLNEGMFSLAKYYKSHGMMAYNALQQQEFALEQSQNYRAIKHQNFVGVDYFDKVLKEIDNDTVLQAISGSTEQQQFHD